MSLMRRAKKLLPHRQCGDATGHDRHAWVVRISNDPQWGEHCYCPGIPMTRRDRQVHRLVADLEDWSA